MPILGGRAQQKRLGIGDHGGPKSVRAPMPKKMNWGRIVQVYRPYFRIMPRNPAMPGASSGEGMVVRPVKGKVGQNHARSDGQQFIGLPFLFNGQKDEAESYQDHNRFVRRLCIQNPFLFQALPPTLSPRRLSFSFQPPVTIFPTAQVMVARMIMIKNTRKMPLTMILRASGQRL